MIDLKLLYKNQVEILLSFESRTLKINKNYLDIRYLSSYYELSISWSTLSLY